MLLFLGNNIFIKFDEGTPYDFYRQSSNYNTRNGFFIHMILMDSDNLLAMNLSETYLIKKKRNERLRKPKLDLVVDKK